MRLSQSILVLAILTLASCSQKKEKSNDSKPYNGSWESLQEMPVPAWFNDGKIGIFIHWGPYSVIGYKEGGAGYAEHVPKLLYEDSTHYYPYMKERWGATPPAFGYKDIINLFHPEKLDYDRFFDVLREKVVPLIHVSIPKYKEVPSGFSGACIMPDQSGLLFTASLEDTESELYDGAILGSFIGYIPLDGLKESMSYSALLTDNNRNPISKKLESIVIKSKTDNKLSILSVSDNDDGSSDIFEMNVYLDKLD